MKNRVIAILLCLSMALAALTVLAEDGRMDMVFTEKDPMQGQSKGEDDEEKSLLDKIKDSNAALMESMGKKDWEALAKAVERTGNWRDDLVAIAKSQEGYAEESGGMTLYTRWAGKTGPVEWTALFVNWAADQIGLTDKQFPKGETYQEMWDQMEKVGALKKISRTRYPYSGDLAMIEKDGQNLVGVVLYVSDGYAAIVYGDDHGKVSRTMHQVGRDGFTHYVDLDVLMARAGIDVGKGGKVPVIPEGGVTAWTKADAIYLRQKPTRQSKSLVTVYHLRTPVIVTSAAKQEDGYIWYGVKYKNYTGYIRGDLLELDKAALPTATPVPTATPAPTPVPGCVPCAQAAGNIVLPVECCYRHLASMSELGAAMFMAELMSDDPATFALYVRCCIAHGKQGDPAVTCLGSECGEAAWHLPGANHAPQCPWHTEGLSVQVRQPEEDIREVRAGQNVMILYDVRGANAYQWHEVRKAVQADGTVVRTDTVLSGEWEASLAVTARDEAGVTYSYYCVATIVSGGVPVEVKSITTVLRVKEATRATSVLTALTITSSGMQPGESAIITVTNKANPTQTWTVAVPNDGSVTIGGLIVGETYIVATAEGWAWRYQPVSQEVTAQAGDAKVHVENTVINGRWMSNESISR